MVSPRATRWIDSGERRKFSTTCFRVTWPLPSAPTDAWHNLAVLALTAGDQERYRAICAEMLTRFGRTDQPEFANTVAWTCCLALGAVADLDRVVQLATLAVAREPNNPSYLNTLGVALYRAGQFESARQRFVQ